MSGGEETAPVERSLRRREANSETDHVGGRFLFLAITTGGGGMRKITPGG